MSEDSNTIKVEKPTPLPEITLKPAIDGEVMPPQAKTAEPIGRNITGAGFLATLIRDQQAKIKQQFAKAGEDMVKLMGEAQELADASTNQVKAGQAEIADLKAALGLNSNEPK